MKQDLIVRILPTKLSPEEINDRARECARQVREKMRVEARAKDSAAEFKEQVKAIDKQIIRLVDATNNGIEDRDVECRVVVMGNEATIFRQDTGEIVETRAARREELQRQQMSLTDMPGFREESR